MYVAFRNYYFAAIRAFDESGRECVSVSVIDSKSGPDIDAFREAALRCPIPAAVELIGEKWAFLILRGAFNGLQHFEEFQAGLGIARNILSDRRKVIYSLTTKGEALLPVVLSIRQWGEDWGYGEMEIVLADSKARRPVRRIRVLAEDGRELALGDMTWISRDELHDKADKAA
jgi:DNA-binding HxlR family transcriptional regulator